MKPILLLALVCVAQAVVAQESEGYDEYAAGMETRRTKIKTNVHHKINQPINKAKRLMNGALLQADARLASSTSPRTAQVGGDVLNYGGLQVSGNTPLKANNIVVVSRPGGMNGLEGAHTRPVPVRRSSDRTPSTGAADPYGPPPGR